MSSTVEYCHLMFPQKLSSSDYLFFYADGENSVVGLIQPTKDSADTPEVYISYEDVVDNMGYYMLEGMELKNGKIYDEYDSRCGGRV